jgi:hypothetical protein
MNSKLNRRERLQRKKRKRNVKDSKQQEATPRRKWKRKLTMMMAKMRPKDSRRC